MRALLTGSCVLSLLWCRGSCGTTPRGARSPDTTHTRALPAQLTSQAALGPYGAWAMRRGARSMHQNGAPSVRFTHTAAFACFLLRRKWSTWELRVRTPQYTQLGASLQSASGLFPTERGCLSTPNAPQLHQKAHAACLSEPPPAVLTAGRRRTSRPRVGRPPACAVRCATARRARG